MTAKTGPPYPDKEFAPKKGKRLTYTDEPTPLEELRREVLDKVGGDVDTDVVDAAIEYAMAVHGKTRVKALSGYDRARVAISASRRLRVLLQL